MRPSRRMDSVCAPRGSFLWPSKYRTEQVESEPCLCVSRGSRRFTGPSNFEILFQDDVDTQHRQDSTCGGKGRRRPRDKKEEKKYLLAYVLFHVAGWSAKQNHSSPFHPSFAAHIRPPVPHIYCFHLLNLHHPSLSIFGKMGILLGIQLKMGDGEGGPSLGVPRARSRLQCIVRDPEPPGCRTACRLWSGSRQAARLTPRQRTFYPHLRHASSRCVMIISNEVLRYVR